MATAMLLWSSTRAATSCPTTGAMTTIAARCSGSRRTRSWRSVSTWTLTGRRNIRCRRERLISLAEFSVAGGFRLTTPRIHVNCAAPTFTNLRPYHRAAARHAGQYVHESTRGPDRGIRIGDRPAGRLSTIHRDPTGFPPRTHSTTPGNWDGARTPSRPVRRRPRRAPRRRRRPWRRPPPTTTPRCLIRNARRAGG
jgi:hypothetical protein